MQVNESNKYDSRNAIGLTTNIKLEEGARSTNFSEIVDHKVQTSDVPERIFMPSRAIFRKIIRAISHFSNS